MAANVFFAYIIASQRKMVRAMRAGQSPDARDGQRAPNGAASTIYSSFTLLVLTP